VENAIVHGIARKEQGGKVSVSIDLKDGGMVEITISDDGLGMKREMLDSLLERLRDSDENSTAKIGIGLGNIYRRINTLYKGAGGLEIESEEGRGTRIVLSIPQEGYDV
ncbi:MAG: hypothetical protein J6I40_03860, partial [Mailhella sp.]|nr:hypothetical protein [Mailhella sp.]